MSCCKAIAVSPNGPLDTYNRNRFVEMCDRAPRCPVPKQRANGLSFNVGRMRLGVCCLTMIAACSADSGKTDQDSGKAGISRESTTSTRQADGGRADGVRADGVRGDVVQADAGRAQIHSLVPDTLTSADRSTLQHPADIALLSDGRIAVLDYGPSSLVVLDAQTGETLTTFARRGKGPGELFYPLGLHVRADTLFTANVGNNRIESFVDGKPIPHPQPLPPFARIGRLGLADDGSILLPTSGRFNTLVRWHNRDGSLRRNVGTPIMTPDTLWRFQENRAAVLRGEVPRYFRNGVISAAEGDSILWIAFNTEPYVERHNTRTGAVTRVNIPSDVAADIRQDVLERNRADKKNATVVGLEYPADVRVFNNALWLLTKSGANSDGHLLRIDAKGTLTDLKLRGARNLSRFTIDSTGTTMFLSATADATLLKVRLP
jgi:hypothetical protein